MRKIRLDVDELSVESFDTNRGEGAAAGTVRGHAVTSLADGCNFSRGTCFQSCGMTNGYQYCILPYC
jgi:hypothetical protein